MTTITEAEVGWAASQGQAPPLTPHHPPVLHSMRELLYTQGHPPSMTHTKMTTDTIALFSGGSSLMRSRRGQMRQVRQMRGRFEIAKSAATPKAGPIPRSALNAGRRCGRCGRFFKNFSATKVAGDSPNVIHTNSTTDIP